MASTPRDTALNRADDAEPMTIDPTPSEVEDWAERERARREAWLRGPTDEERAAFARRERERRLGQLGRDREVEALAIAREMLRYPREAQLAAEGAMSLMWKWYRRRMAELVQAGRGFEQELVRPDRPHRVPLDQDES